MMERLTILEFQDRCREQDHAREDIAFVCPVCATVQSMNSLVAAGASFSDAERMIGFSCEGRLTGAGEWPRNPYHRRRTTRGCDWSLGGLFRIHVLEVVDQTGTIHPMFKLGTNEQAKLLRSYCAAAKAALG